LCYTENIYIYIIVFWMTDILITGNYWCQEFWEVTFQKGQAGIA